MNSNHRPGQDDNTLSGDLDKLAQAYRREDADEPPRLLDQAVLGSARRAVSEKPRRLQFGWIHGLTTTAVVVLAIAIYHFQQPPTGPLQRAAAPAPVEPPQRPAEGREQEQDTLVRRLDYRTEALATGAGDAAVKDDADAEPGASAAAPVTPAPAAQTAVGQPQEEATVKAGRLLDEKAQPTLKESERLKKEADDEARIQVILALKRAGDDAWRDALREFVSTHPDYPLPEELKH